MTVISWSNALRGKCFIALGTSSWVTRKENDEKLAQSPIICMPIIRAHHPE